MTVEFWTPMAFPVIIALPPKVVFTEPVMYVLPATTPKIRVKEALPYLILQAHSSQTHSKSDSVSEQSSHFQQSAAPLTRKGPPNDSLAAWRLQSLETYDNQIKRE